MCRLAWTAGNVNCGSSRNVRPHAAVGPFSFRTTGEKLFASGMESRPTRLADRNGGRSRPRFLAASGVRDDASS
jgi:hypothetical protein